MSRRLRLLGLLLGLPALVENESVSTTFAPTSPAPYLSKTLRAQGAYLPRYYGIGHASNDNYIAMVSGQAPNLDNQTDCQTFGKLPGHLDRR